MLICRGWRSNKKCEAFPPPEPRSAWLCLLCLSPAGSVSQQPLCVWPRCFVIISYVFRNRRQQSDHSVLSRKSNMEKVRTWPGCPLLRLTVNKCERTNNEDTHVCKHTHAYTHKHSGLPLPRLIYEGHKDIIALVTYGGSRVPHAESCPRVSCCPLCYIRSGAIEGNT